MTRKSHYAVLGIGRNENADGVRSAYLQLVKDFHPDHSGLASAGEFRAVQEAYDVLSDPVRRRVYDRELDSRRFGVATRPVTVDRRRPVEPLIPEAPAEALSPAGRIAFGRDLGSLFDAVSGDLGSSGILADEPASEPDIEVWIPAEVAARGGDVEVELPVRIPCPACGGTGAGWPFGCVGCGGRGWLPARRAFRLSLPPALRPNTLVRLESAGGLPLTLRLKIGRR